MDPGLLRTFLAVAGRLSFRKAAEALHLAPSTVSTQVRALEQELGAALFERLGRRVLLTAPGERLLHYARRMLDLEAEARSSLGRGPEAPGELVVRLSETLGIHCLPAMLCRFRQGFPATRLTLALASAHGLARDLRQGVTDLALILGGPVLDAEIAVEVLGREPLAIIAAPDSALAGRAAADAAALAGHTLILTPHVWSARPLIEQALLAARAAPAGLVECASVEIVKRCVAAGLGVSVVPAFAVREEAAAGRLVVLDWAPGPLTVPVLLARNPERRPSLAAEAFAAAAREFFPA